MTRTIVLFACAVAMAAAANPLVPTSRGRIAPLPSADDFLVGFWAEGRFDPLFDTPQLPPELALDAYPGDGSGWYLVQFAGPVYQQQVRELARHGLFLGFHSRLLGFVRTDRAGAGAISDLGFVRWIGVYQPGYKYWPGTLAAAGQGRVTLVLFYPEDLDRAVAAVTALGTAVARTGESDVSKVIEVDVTREQLPVLARLPFVQSIEEWHPAEPENELCQWVVQDWEQNQRRIWAQGIFGSDEVLGYTDTGLYMNHWAFNDPAVPLTDTGEFPTHRKVVIYRHYPPAGGVGDANGHGTHVAGTMAGNDSLPGGTNVNDGHAKSARIAHLSPIPTPPGNDFTEPLNMITNDLRNPELRPHTISNSWWTGTMGQYTNAAATFDQFAWRNRDILLIKSCGNQGQSSQYRITEPGNAKSVVAAGGVLNGASSNQIYTTSSRGPAPDGRVKPELCVPSVSITSASSGTQNGYTQMSGTSMAAPAVNGCAGLLRNYLRAGFYPTGAANPTDSMHYVSAALLKTLLLVSADPNVGSYTVPSEYIGWGRVNLDSVMYFSLPTPDVRKLLLDDDTLGLATGEYVEYHFEVTDSIPLRAGVSWTDTAAAAGASPALINDLDCLLTGPGGVFFKGSVYSSGASVPNPSQAHDNLNPVEMFRVNRPAPGTWTLRVTAQSVVTERQPFAVVITGALSTSRRDVGVARIVAPVGTLDSGTFIAPACSVYNYGTETESYSVSYRVGQFANGSSSVTDHAPGTMVGVTFGPIGLDVIGTFAVVCSTTLAGDVGPVNDRLVDTLRVRRPLHDVAALSVLAPVDTVDSGTVVAPRALVWNAGSYSETFAVLLAIGAGYLDTVTVSGLDAGATDTVEFADWTASPLGTVAVALRTLLAGDESPVNDTASASVVVWPHTAVREAAGAPAGSGLEPARPTPFRVRTAIRFNLAAPERVELGIYNSAGRLVRRLGQGWFTAGTHSLVWDGCDDAGHAQARGVYHCRLAAGGLRSIEKLVKLD
jgi:subtilisin family serine protease